VWLAELDSNYAALWNARMLRIQLVSGFQLMKIWATNLSNKSGPKPTVHRFESLTPSQRKLNPQIVPKSGGYEGQSSADDERVRDLAAVRRRPPPSDARAAVSTSGAPLPGCQHIDAIRVLAQSTNYSTRPDCL
jgi:hypothetical protein